mmetsp:Transcript_25715/g.59990  ORF Transcript_25715/g.59990 Transcript_25715/m.59990 type:complete len:699 (-) Transcript_25715:114-2210(-)|eukprot:CAMPEP_0178405056 /NCGR_PEP_ID=MMETSP0689_2-20121128/18204_1 /TAXON_ID=160604 /ORGANISM="Amphidinium massartii, Strain CS-259" /LENGTH=698 /DNA_ID=CAMNT_0020026063 /DNA_START=12 /DNA_END=2108 /DNA_ORIENTATION=-
MSRGGRKTPTGFVDDTMMMKTLVRAEVGLQVDVEAVQREHASFARSFSQLVEEYERLQAENSFLEESLGKAQRASVSQQGQKPEKTCSNGQAVFSSLYAREEQDDEVHKARCSSSTTVTTGPPALSPASAAVRGSLPSGIITDTKDLSLALDQGTKGAGQPRAQSRSRSRSLRVDHGVLENCLLPGGGSDDKLTASEKLSVMQRSTDVMHMIGSYREWSKKVCEPERLQMHSFSFIQTAPNFVTKREKPRLVRLVEGRTFESFFGALIVANMAFFGIEAQHRASCRCSSIPGAYTVIDYTFTAMFVAELLVRVFAYKARIFSNKHGLWNLLDLVIVTISLGEILFTETKLDSGSVNLSHVRIMRTVRTFRIFRMIRLVRFFRSLRILVHSILKTLRSLVWTMILLCIIMYLFAILFTEAATQYLIDEAVARREELELSLQPDLKAQEISQDLEEHFGSVYKAMFALFKGITCGMNWEDLSEPISHTGGFWLAMFIFYISFAFFAVLNVVTGVFCQSAIESAAHDDDMVVQEMLEEKNRYIKRLWKLVTGLDEDQSGTISLEELEVGLRREEVREYFDTLDIPVEDAWTLLQLLARGEDHKVSAEDFITGCLRLKGHAKALQMAVLMNENRQVQQNMLETLVHANAKLASMWARMSGPVNQSRHTAAGMESGEFEQAEEGQTTPTADSEPRRLEQKCSL